MKNPPSGPTTTFFEKCPRCGASLSEGVTSCPRCNVFVRCRKCGGNVYGRANSCQYCGTSLDPIGANVCPKCGSRFPESVSFCLQCGQSFEGYASSFSSAPAPQKSKKHLNPVLKWVLIVLGSLFSLVAICYGSGFCPPALSTVFEPVLIVCGILFAVFFLHFLVAITLATIQTMFRNHERIFAILTTLLVVACIVLYSLNYNARNVPSSTYDDVQSIITTLEDSMIIETSPGSVTYDDFERLYDGARAALSDLYDLSDKVE